MTIATCKCGQDFETSDFSFEDRCQECQPRHFGTLAEYREALPTLSREEADGAFVTILRNEVGTRLTWVDPADGSTHIIIMGAA